MATRIALSSRKTPLVRLRMMELGIPGAADRVLRNNPTAERDLQNVTLVDWATELAVPLIERDCPRKKPGG